MLFYIFKCHYSKHEQQNAMKQFTSYVKADMSLSIDIFHLSQKRKKTQFTTSYKNKFPFIFICNRQGGKLWKSLCAMDKVAHFYVVINL